MDKFNLENQFSLYLKRMRLDPAKMHEVQLRETKRAFFGSAGQMLILMRDGISQLPEETGIDKLQSMLEQVGEFFNNGAN